jgi:hypothetical protein
MLSSSADHAPPPNTTPVFGGSTSTSSSTPSTPAAAAKPVEPVVATATTTPAAPAEPAPAAPTTETRTDPSADVLAVLLGAGPGTRVTVDAIHADVNADKGKAHLARGPLETMLTALVDTGRAVKHPDGTYEIASEERFERESPGLARGARCAVVAAMTICMGESVAQNALPFDIARTIRGHVAGSSLPVAWRDAFLGGLADNDVAAFEARVVFHLERLVAKKLADTRLVDKLVDPLHEELVQVLDCDPAALRTAMDDWGSEQHDAAEAWLTAGKEPGDEGKSFAEVRAAWFGQMPEHVKPFFSTDPETGEGEDSEEPVLETDAPAEEPVRASVYWLTAESMRLVFERGVETLVARSYGDDAPPSLDEVKARFDKVLEEATRVSQARGEENLAVWQGEAQRANRELAKANELVKAYERWYAKQGILDPRIRIATPTGGDPEFPVESFEETREVTTAELHRMIGEKASLKAHLAATMAENIAKRKAFSAVEEEIKGKIDALESAIERSSVTGTTHHVVKKKVQRVVRDGRMVTLSADDHDRGTVLKIEEIGHRTQLTIPGTGAAGPAWTPTASPSSNAKATAADVKAPAESATMQVKASGEGGFEPPAEPAKLVESAAAPEVPAWTGDTATTLANVRHMLVGIDGRAGLGLFQTSLGAKGILREEVVDKLAAFIGHPGADSGLEKLVVKVLKSAETSGDLLSGTRLEGGAAKGILWHKSFDLPANVIVSEGSAKLLQKSEKAAKKGDKVAAPAALPKEPPGRGAKKAAAKAPAQKTVAHAKGRSGKAAARR